MNTNDTNEKGHDQATVMTDKELDAVVGGDFGAAVAPIAALALVNTGLVVAAAIAEHLKRPDSTVEQDDSETGTARGSQSDVPA